MIDESGSNKNINKKLKGIQKYFDVLKSDMFKFPFSHVNVTTPGIEELHNPLKMSFEDIKE